jgi:hypothetical protein
MKNLSLDKIQIPQETLNLYPHHRFGWRRVIQELNNHCPNSSEATFLEPFFERVFLYNEDNHRKKIYEKHPWVAFIHEPPKQARLEYNFSLSNHIQNTNLQCCLKNLKGIFTLTNYQKRHYLRLPDLKGMPISNLLYPIEYNIKWDINNFNYSALHIGSNYRNIDFFNEYTFADFIKNKILIGPDSCSRKFDDEEYDKLLTSSFVFQKYFDCAASTTIIECITTETPIIVNQIEPIEEYLGESYPLFYKSTDELGYFFSSKDIFLNKLIEANLYLKELNSKNLFTYDKFLHDFYHSQVYHSL